MTSLDYQFNGYKTHIVPKNKTYKTTVKEEFEEYQEDQDFGINKIQYQQLDERLRILEQQMKRLCHDADKATQEGHGDNDVYQVGNSSYQQAKINGIKQQINKLNQDN